MIFLLSLFIHFSQISFAAVSTASINGLLDAEIMATEKKIKAKPLPTYYFRLLTLYSEKCKNMKDTENEQYLKNVEKGDNQGKDNFFSFSSSLAKKADDFGFLMIKLFPNYQKLGEVYYMMGTNDRDYGKGVNTEDYFLKALSSTLPNSDMIFEVKTALADYYYNEKKYQKAITLYEEILKNKSNVWWTKYAYNYAWCLLKVEQNAKALSTLLNVYEISKNSKSVNMSRDILGSISLFFYYAKQLPESLIFFKKETSEPFTYGLKMAHLLSKKGHLKEAKESFTSITHLATNDNDKFSVLLGLLNLHHE